MGWGENVEYKITSYSGKQSELFGNPFEVVFKVKPKYVVKNILISSIFYDSSG